MKNHSNRLVSGFERKLVITKLRYRSNIKKVNKTLLLYKCFVDLGAYVNSDLLKLQKEMVSAVRKGHTGFFNTNDVAYWVKKTSRDALTLFIYNAIKAGVLERVCKGVYVVSIFKPSGVVLVKSNRTHS